MYGCCSGSCSKICFNPSCRVSESESWRKGWQLRSGEIAELCDSCGSAYEEMRFCEVFHSDTAGWRNCESCGKIMHCGCVASVHMFILLDTGGVECMSCARRSSIIMASNQIWPPSIFLPLYFPESLVDLSGKNYNQITGPNSGSEQWQQPPTFWDAANGGSELYPWMSNLGVDRSNTFALSGDFSSAFAQEKKNIKDLPEEEKIKSLQDSGHLTGGTDPSYPRRGAITNLKTYSSLCADDSPETCVSRDDPSALLSGIAISFSSPEANDPTRVSGSQAQRKTPLMFPKPSYLSSLVVLESTGESESQIRSARPQGKGQVQSHLLPRYRYWPRITDQELQRISGDSNSVITPLFEKMLSASDAGPIGRLVLPKKCAEAYFPMISQPEGLPLKVLDVKGKEWVFQFRFWPHNNSRMYVLEGVTPCIQSMQLQEGDIVTFSRIDPEGKLVMGFRKAASSHSEKGILPPKIGNCISPGEEVINGSTKPGEVNSTLSLYSSKGSI